MKPITHPASLWPELLKGIALSLMLCGLWPQIAQAQYKWVGRDGVVHYSDLPPPAGARLLPRGGPIEGAGTSAATPASTSGTALTSGPASRSGPASPSGTAAVSGPAWPASLAQAVRQAPVVLYTTAGCPPCDEGRALLQSRGVPVTEKRIETDADLKALLALNIPSSGFPVLTVGNQRAIGFEQGQWQRMLDGAKYPATSVLPRGWQPDAATNLSTTSSPPADREAPSQPSLPTQSAPTQSGSSRIRF